jgi:hypothetical protein
MRRYSGIPLVPPSPNAVEGAAVVKAAAAAIAKPASPAARRVRRRVSIRM